MENVIHRLTLDLTGPDLCPMIEVQRGDSARSLIISLTQGGRPYWIEEGLTAALYGKKPDGNPLFNACTIEKNRIRYDFTPQTANVAGAFDCEIWLVAGDKREMTTPRFTIAVDERMRTDDVIPESEPEYTAITEMVAAGTAMIEELREALAGLEGVEEILTQARAAAEAASNSEAAAGGHAKTAADAAADALGSAGRAYASEQTAVTAAGDAQVQAETAQGYTLRAEAAAKRAEEAAAGVGTGGNGSGQNANTIPDYVRAEAERVAENVLSITGEGGTVGEATYTNLIPTAHALESADVYNGVGYKNGYYASSATPYENTDAACVLTGLIPYDGSYGATELPAIYIKGATIDTSNTHVRFQVWSEGKVYLNGLRWGTDVTVETIGGNYYKLNFASDVRTTYGAFGYFRLSLVGYGDPLIVTVGEPIEESIVKTADSPTLNLAFLTDLHYNETYADGLKHAAQGLAVIGETAAIDAVVFGGDYVSTNSDTEVAKSHISACKQIFAGAAGMSMEIWLRGNHDNVPYPESDGSDPRISRMECYNRTGRRQYNAIGYMSNPADPGGNYGYIDFDASKIRLICLNTVDNDHFGIGDSLTDAYHVSGTQLKWLAENALDFTGKGNLAEWGIVVVSHVPVYSNAWMDTHTYTDAAGTAWIANVVNAKNLLMAYVNGETFDATVDGVTVSADYSTQAIRAKMLCAISGHQHALTSYSGNGWLTIGCPNASHLRTNENGYAQDADIDGNTYGNTPQEKTVNSARDTAFTIITIDRAGGKIYAWCYGAGYDRVFDMP